MMQQIWKSFPRDLEQKVNGLLDEAVPNPIKAFQLYKTCQAENLWNESFEKFSSYLNEFCARPRIDRSKGQFDRYLQRPMDNETFDHFHLNFRTAQIEPTAVRNIASWAHHLMRINMKVEEQAISISVIEKTLTRLTNPTSLDKDNDIEFSDFCEAWVKIAGPVLGEQKKFVLNGLLNDLKRLDIQSRNLDSQASQNTSVDVSYIYLTQTELDWAAAVAKAAFAYGNMPRYPLRKGPDKPPLVELEKIVTLYNLVQLAGKPELAKHRENIRLTILDRCDLLLKDKVA